MGFGYWARGFVVQAPLGLGRHYILRIWSMRVRVGAYLLVFVSRKSFPTRCWLGWEGSAFLASGTWHWYILNSDLG